VPGYKTRHKGILRLEYPERHLVGYRVVVGWNGERHTKYFSDRTYGERIAALAEAIEWRNAVEKKIGKPRTDQPIVGTVRRSKTKSGIVGVRRHTINHTSYYSAQWSTIDGRKTKKYSVTKYGENQARRLAIKARKAGERERRRNPYRNVEE
jgi:AP2 domain